MSLSRITTHDGGFYDQDGNRKTYCGFNYASALERFIHGKDIDAMLDQFGDALAEVRAQAAKFGDGRWIMPVVRLDGMGEQADNQVFSLYPQHEPTFWTSVAAFADYLAFGQNGRWQFYTDLDVFENAMFVMPNRPDQIRHWEKMGNVAASRPWLFLSIAKEAEHQGNQVDVQAFSAPPDGVLWSRGSNGAGEDPPDPNGARYAKYHGKRGDTKGLLAATDALFAKRGYQAESAGGHSYGGNPGIPVIVEETAKLNEVETGSDTTDTRAFYWHGVYAARCGGGTFHSHGGQFGEPLGNVQMTGLRGFIMGCAKADPVQQYVG